MSALLYLICALVWGTTWFAIRVCIGPGGYPTFMAASGRFLLAGVVLSCLVLLFKTRPYPNRQEWKALLIAATFNSIGYALTYTAEETLTGGVVAVIFGCAPLLTAFVANLTKSEPVRRSQVTSAVISLLGIVLVFSDRFSVSSDQALSVIFAIGACCMSVGYSVVFKRSLGRVNPMASTGAFLGFTAILMTGLAVLSAKPIPSPLPGDATLALIYLALIGSVLSFVCFFLLLKRTSLMTSASLNMVVPIIALIVDAIFESQALPPRAYLGIAITLLGVGVGIYSSASQHRRARRSIAPPIAR